MESATEVPYTPRMAKHATLLLLAAALLSTGCGSDDCHWDRRCESVNGELTCVWVKVCPGSGSTVQDVMPLSVYAPMAGERWDVRTGSVAVGIDGRDALADRLLGAEVADRLASLGRTGCWFHGWPANEVRRAEGPLPGGVLEEIRIAAEGDDAKTSGCSALHTLDRDALVPLPGAVFVGDPLLVYAPLAEALHSHAPSPGLAIYLEAPDGTPRTPRFVPAGETARLDVDEPGRWRVRVVLLSVGLCDSDVADAVIVQEGFVEVVAGP